mgnify:CR=1 FL=1
MFRACASGGAGLFDTGDSYGTGELEGQSEKLLGQFLRELPEAEQQSVVLATKLAAYPTRLTRGSMVAALEASLARMGRERTELAQLHWSTAMYAPWQERPMWDGLGDMVERGLAGAVGVSNYGPRQLRRAHAHLAARGVPLATCQVQFSLLSDTRLQRETQEACEELGVALVAYSPLALGALSGAYSGTPEAGSAPTRVPKGALRRLLVPYLVRGQRPLLAAMEAVAEERGKTVAQVAINWCLCQGRPGAPVVPLVGARTPDQARENLGAAGWRLSAAEATELEAAARRGTARMTQNAFQSQ